MVDIGEIHLSPIKRSVEGKGGPYFDWLTLEVSLIRPGFNVVVTWEAMPSEIEAFSKSILEMNKDIEPGKKAVLNGVEENIEIILTMEKNGHIPVNYNFSPPHPNEGPNIKGMFWIDQSYLPQILNQLEILLTYPPQSFNSP
jgi:hypothetical protein